MASEPAKDSGPTAESGPDKEQDLFVECSDDEVYTKDGYVKGKMTSWQPKSDEVVELLENLTYQNGAESVVLDWTCPGRRPLTPSTESEYSDSDDEAAKEAAKAALDFEFDADEDLKMTPTLSSGRKSLTSLRELKGSARKRTSDYKSILNNLERHRKMDEAEKAASTTPSK